MKIEINDPGHWKQLLVENELSIVVDPLVLRSGEIFLKGSTGNHNPAEAWDFLTRNIHAVGMFFDSLVLQEKIPVFNYGDTFDATLNFGERTLTEINQYEEVLFDVEVGYNEYQKVKDAALTELSKIYNDSEPAKIKRSTALDIIGELSISGYQWGPGLGNLENDLKSEDEKQLARYLLGGLIFGGYAQQMGTEHLLQPKRSRIFAALAMKASSASRQVEKELFTDLKKYANTSMDEIPWMPTFFPYLLDKANSPGELLKAVVKLRGSEQIKEYRKWLKELIDDWRINGKISEKKRKDILQIKEKIEREMKIAPNTPKVEFKVNIAEVVGGKIPSPEIDLTKSIEGLWGWMLESLPGRRYRKILTRAILTDHEYINLDKRMRTVWSS